jgi:HEAT repeat protein
VLGRRGDAGQVAPLVQMAAEADQEIAKAARAALSNLQGEKVNAALAERLANASGAELRALAEVAAERRIEATAALTKALSDADASVRKAALAALGATVNQQDLNVLIDEAISPKLADDREAAWQALKAAAVRMPNREACADALAEALQKASADGKVQLVEILGAVSGPKSINAIAGAISDGTDQIKDAGTRVLGAWMTVDAAPVLLKVAKDPASSKYQVRALRGYLRLARQFPMSDDQRAEMCEKALAAAKRPEERKLAVEVLARYPSEQTMALALKAAQDPALKQDAARAVMAIAQARELDGGEVQELLAKIGLEPVKVEIVKAEYGSGQTQRDVTDTLRKRLHDLPLITLPKASYNKSFGGDPAPGSQKQLVVEYKINGKEGKATFAENQAIMLPTPK